MSWCLFRGVGWGQTLIVLCNVYITIMNLFIFLRLCFDTAHALVFTSFCGCASLPHINVFKAFLGPFQNGCLFNIVILRITLRHWEFEGLM